MDTHSRKKQHQAETTSDNAGPVPETRPVLTGIFWQKESGNRSPRFFWLMRTRQSILADCWERWLPTEMYIASAVTWAPARP